MLHIRKLRTFVPKNSDTEKSFDAPLDPDLRVKDHGELFENLNTYLLQIPEKERWNIFYTVGHTSCLKNRDWLEQDVIGFDFDHLDERFFDKTIEVFKATLGISQCVIVASGHGLQFLVPNSEKITDKVYFKKNLHFYKGVLSRLDAGLKAAGVKGYILDASCFAANRLMRLAGTENRKKAKPVVEAKLLAAGFKETLDLQKVSGIPSIAEEDQLSEKVAKSFRIDDDAVLEGCNFLHHCKENPHELDEPTWYAMLSIVGRLGKDNQIAHEFSQGHPGYNYNETEQKLEQALHASGPRTCKNINALWDRCGECKHFNTKVESPISIRGENFIPTEFTGFHRTNAKGQPVPQFEDLRKFLNREKCYKTEEDSGRVKMFDTTHYVPWATTRIRNFADTHFDPKPREAVANEFVGWVTRTNLVKPDWYMDTTHGHINFANGTLDIETRTLTPHSPDRGFLYVLPYNYDPYAKCPEFLKLMERITCGDKSLQTILLEFIGYAICDQNYWLQKYVVLLGEGANGKSTFLKIVENLMGKENTAHLSMTDLQSETHRSQLEGKLINISDELPNVRNQDTENLKKLLGGKMTTRKLYHNGSTIHNTCKFIFAGNQLPKTSDTSWGQLRRMVIVPFNATFNLGDPETDTNIVKKKILNELPGIFNLVLEHYLRLFERQNLTQSEASAAELAEYQNSIDVAGSWVKEHLKITGNENDFISNKMLFDAFCDSARSEEERLMTYRDFHKHLKRHIPNFKSHQKQMPSGNRERGLCGVKILPEGVDK